MQSVTSRASSARSFERFLAILGAAACLIITTRIWQVVALNQPIWPFPALYLIEMMALSLIAVVFIVQDHPLAGAVAWAIIGAYLGFAVMGAWSVGFYFLPVALPFAIAALSIVRRRKQRALAYFTLSIAAGLLQAALMFAVIQLLYPSVVF